jgi:hypothetical protein
MMLTFTDRKLISKFNAIPIFDALFGGKQSSSTKYIYFLKGKGSR